MTAMKEGIKHDLRKDPRDLEREADTARADLERTLEALEERLAPGALAEQVIRAVRQNGSEFGSNLAAQVRTNPLPTLLASAGLTWLMAASKGAPAQGRVGDGEARLSDRESAAAKSARHAAHRVSDGAHDTADAMRAAGTKVADSTRSGAQNLHQRWSYMNQEHPLVIGALAVAVGAAMAAWMPRTETEDEWLGDASDDVKARAGDELEKRVEEAGESAAGTADSVRQPARSREQVPAGEHKSPPAW